jgi:hypothetical protein
VGEKYRLNFCAGPSIGFLTNSHVFGTSFSGGQSNNGQGSATYWTEDGPTTDFRGDLRLFVKIGLEIPLGSTFRFSIDNSYSQGLSTTASGSMGSYAG